MLERILKKLRPTPRHPVDLLYGIETSVFVGSRWLKVGDAEADAANVGYAGSQPSVIRKALATLGDLRGAHFIDLGCGKGRVLAVASEHPFASITGIELSRKLAAQGDRNCRKVAALHQSRPRATVIVGDASRPIIPPRGRVILFLYNPFHAPLVSRLLTHIEGQPNKDVWIVYYNPVCAGLVDESPAFRRYFAEKIAFSPEETGAFDNDFDSVVIWKPASCPVQPLPGSDRKVVVTVPNLGAVVAR